jgi:hypothetical protein
MRRLRRRGWKIEGDRNATGSLKLAADNLVCIMSVRLSWQLALISSPKIFHRVSASKDTLKGTLAITRSSTVVCLFIRPHNVRGDNKLTIPPFTIDSRQER